MPADVGALAEEPQREAGDGEGGGGGEPGGETAGAAQEQRGGQATEADRKSVV